MTVLVGNTDGYLVLADDGGSGTSGRGLGGREFGERGLAGHEVGAFGRGPRGEWLAVVDRQSIHERGDDGRWVERAVTDAELTALVPLGDAVFAGTRDARVLRIAADGAVEALGSFAEVPGRAGWHAVGGPLQVRSMAATCDGCALLANVHVGGIPRSVDGGRTWSPTIAVDDDVHEVCAHPTRPGVVVAAAAVGLGRSADGGATWRVSTEGLHASYARAVAVLGDDVLVSASDGPRATRSAVYRAPVDGGAAERVGGGLPEWLAGNVDTGRLVTDGRRVALADGAGDVWVSDDGLAGWRLLAPGVPGITRLALA